jgi:hypothetical protein
LSYNLAELLEANFSKIDIKKQQTFYPLVMLD